MRLLIDACLSPAVAAALQDGGHDALHVQDLGLLTTPDSAILLGARQDQRVLISADADFGALLAGSGEAAPSLVLLRSSDDLTPQQQAALLLANLPVVANDLETGAIVVLGRRRMRIRTLPVGRSS